MSKPSKTRVTDVAFLLKSRPATESSLYVDMFTRNHGRILMMAKGARRRMSEFKGSLVAFSPVEISWTGTGDIKTLSKATWMGGHPLPLYPNLLEAWRMNEMLGRLTAREDPHPVVFDMYAGVMRLMSERSDILPEARLFEWGLLRELGFAPALKEDMEGDPIDPKEFYIMRAEAEPVLLEKATSFPEDYMNPSCLVIGRTLVQLEEGAFDERDVFSLNDAKRLIDLYFSHLAKGDFLSGGFDEKFASIISKVKEVGARERLMKAERIRNKESEASLAGGESFPSSATSHPENGSAIASPSLGESPQTDGEGENENQDKNLTANPPKNTNPHIRRLPPVPPLVAQKIGKKAMPGKMERRQVEGEDEFDSAGMDFDRFMSSSKSDEAAMAMRGSVPFEGRGVSEAYVERESYGREEFHGGLSPEFIRAHLGPFDAGANPWDSSFDPNMAAERWGVPNSMMDGGPFGFPDPREFGDGGNRSQLGRNAAFGDLTEGMLDPGEVLRRLRLEASISKVEFDKVEKKSWRENSPYGYIDPNSVAGKGYHPDIDWNGDDGGVRGEESFHIEERGSRYESFDGFGFGMVEEYRSVHGRRSERFDSGMRQGYGYDATHPHGGNGHSAGNQSMRRGGQDGWRRQDYQGANYSRGGMEDGWERGNIPPSSGRFDNPNNAGAPMFFDPEIGAHVPFDDYRRHEDAPKMRRDGGRPRNWREGPEWDFPQNAGYGGQPRGYQGGAYEGYGPMDPMPTHGGGAGWGREPFKGRNPSNANDGNAMRPDSPKRMEGGSDPLAGGVGYGGPGDRKPIRKQTSGKDANATANDLGQASFSRWGEKKPEDSINIPFDNDPAKAPGRFAEKIEPLGHPHGSQANSTDGVALDETKEESEGFQSAESNSAQSRDESIGDIAGGDQDEGGTASYTTPFVAGSGSTHGGVPLKDRLKDMDTLKLVEDGLRLFAEKGRNAMHQASKNANGDSSEIGEDESLAQSQNDVSMEDDDSMESGHNGHETSQAPDGGDEAETNKARTGEYAAAKGDKAANPATEEERPTSRSANKLAGGHQHASPARKKNHRGKKGRRG